MDTLPHSDVVGSLLRPPELLRARDNFAKGCINEGELSRAEDHAIDEAVAVQEHAGLAIVTDGEMRRLSFQSQLPTMVDGFGEFDINAFLWGDWHSRDELGEMKLERPKGLGVVGALKRKNPLSVGEFTYLKERTRHIPKITLPSPSLFANFWSPQYSKTAYPTLDLFLQDVATILRDEVSDLVEHGATYIQLDAPQYPLVLDPTWASFYESQGWGTKDWVARGIELDNFVMSGFPNVTFGFHL